MLDSTGTMHRAASQSASEGSESWEAGSGDSHLPRVDGASGVGGRTQALWQD